MRKLLLIFCLSSAFIAHAQDYSCEYALNETNATAGSNCTIVSAIMDSNNYQYLLSNYQASWDVFNGDTVYQHTGTFFGSSGGVALRKTDAEGNVIWSKNLSVQLSTGSGNVSGAKDVFGKALAWQNDGTILMMVAKRKRGTLWFDTVSLTDFQINPNNCGLYLINIDTNGNVIWKQRFQHYWQLSVQSAAEYEYISLLETDENGDIYVAGAVSKYIMVGDTTTYSVGSNNGIGYENDHMPFAMKLNSSGEVIWLKRAYYTGSFSKRLMFGKHTIRATLDDSNNVYLSFLSSVNGSNSTITIDQHSTTTSGTSQHFYLAKLNSETGACQWFKRIPCMASSVSSTAPYGHLGPLLVFNNVLHVPICPHYGTDLDSIIFSSSVHVGPNNNYGTVSINAKYDLNGNFIDYDEILTTNSSNTIGGNHSFQLAKVHDNKIYYVIQNVHNVSINNVTVNTYAAGGTVTMIVEYDPENESYSLVDFLVGDVVTGSNYYTQTLSMVFRPNNDFYLSGSYFQAMNFGEITISSSSGKYGYLAKFRSCDYLVQHLVGDSTFCVGESTTLHAPSHDGVTYAWSQNGYIINNQSDSVLQTSVAGTYRVIISDTMGCQKTSSPLTVVVGGSGGGGGGGLNLSFSSICEDADSIVLAGGFPTGGAYFGTGVSAGTFDPSAVSLGNNAIYYAYVDSIGCNDTASDMIYVAPAPSVYFYPSISTVCTEDTITLTGGYPTGGTYSGPGVSGGQFFTSAAGAGTHTLYYTKTNTYGCSAMDSISVTVNQGPNVSLNIATTNICNSASPLLLTGQSPTGGTFSGTGVSGNYFIPQIVDPGDYVITYSKTQNGCTGTATDHIFVDSMPLAAISALDTICVSATAWSLSGGSPAGGTYNGTGISSGAINASIPGIGTSTVYYSFTNSCGTSTTDTTIAIIASPTISATASNASCFGFDDGSLSATISGGFGPYAYAWSSGDTTSNASSLVAGTYTLSVSGDRGCVASNSFSVAQPAVLALNLDSVDDVVCNGFSNGQAFVNTAGGTATYSYLWSTGATSEDVSSLGSGTHSLTVTDAQGCQDSLSVGVLELNPIVPLGSFTNLTCFESNNGTASVTVSGGGGTYSYAWNSGSTSNALSSLSAGTYVLTVTDQNSCTAMDTVVVDQPDSLEISTSVTDVSCFAASDGAIATTAQGGTGSYSYAWNNGASTANLSGLTSGTYVLTLTDANGCTAAMSALADQPDSLDISFSVSQAILCFGNSNGAIGATVTGGSQPYTYSWSGGGGSATKSGIAAGTYTVTVTDINGCSKSMSHVLTQPTQLTLSIDSVDHANCFGTATAFVGVAASGGTGNLVYNWINGATAAIQSNITAGTYSITVTDANSCTATAIASVTQPAQINLGLSSTNVSCFGGSTGQINTNVTNNQGAASYAWSNGSTSASITALTAGSYGITITDSAGCTQTGSSNITQPTALSTTLTNQNLNCFGDASGTIAASASGGTGTKTFAWNTGASTSTISGLSAGTYAVTVTDSLGCTLTDTATITEPAVLGISLSAQTNLTCFNNASGVAQFSASGGTPNYTYTWSDNGSGASRTGLNAATYTATVSDNNSCTASATVALTQPTQLIISIDSSENVLCNGDNNGAIFASAAGGTGSISYVWSNSQTTQNISALAAGTYSVTATDANNCFTTATHTVTQPQVLDAYILTQNDVLCYGDSTGMIEVDGAGGTEPFHFLWNDGDTNGYRNTLLSGLYLISITDSNGCTDTVSTFIGQSDSIEIIVSSLQHNPCFGDSLGTILVFGQGGSGTFNNYLWSNGSVNVALNGLSAGNYTVTVTDTYNCTKARTITVNEPQALTLSAILTMANCDNTNDGQISVDVDDGTLPYVLTWNTGASDTVINTLDSGNYTVLITDSHNCLLMDTFTLGFDHIAPNPGLGPDTTVCEFSGFTLEASSTGTMYSWSSGETTVSIPINSTGTYAVTATDTFGCAGSDTAVVSVNAAPAFTLSNDTLMCGATLAEQGLAIHGPVGMSAYNWSSGATTQIDTARSAGSYVLVVTDSNGCSFADSMIIAYDTCLGVSSAGGPAISIYPNPTFGEFTIETANADLLDISIYSTAGRLVSHFTLTDRKLISLEAFGAGIYHLSVTTSNGKTSFFKVVVL